MMDYYIDFISRLPLVQKEYLERYLRVRDITIPDGYLGSGPHSIGNYIDAVYNGNMDEVRYDDLMDAVKIDLNSFFGYSSIIDTDITSNEDMAKNYIKYANRVIDSIEGRLIEYRSLLGDIRGYNASHTEYFSEVTTGRFINTSCSGGYLTLTPRSIVSYNGSSDIESLSVTKYPTGMGIYYASPPERDITRDYTTGTRKMLEGGTKSYWLEVMLTTPSVDTPPTAYVDGNTYTGLTLVLTIYFTGSRYINELVIDPISKYIVSVPKVRYLSDYDTWSNLTYIDSLDNTLLVSVEGYGKVNLRFTPVTTYGIEVTLNVCNYDMLHVDIPKSVAITSKIWEEIADDEYKRLGSKYRDRNLTSGSRDEDSNRIYDKVVNKEGELDTASNIDLLDIKVDDIPIENVMHEYVLGLYSLSPTISNYNTTGTYYSHWDGGYDTRNGTIRKVMLECSEEKPACTSIEYYIVTDNDDEIPILPYGTTKYRESAKGEYSGADLLVTPTFSVDGDVDILMWDGSSKVVVDTQTPVDGVVTFSSLPIGPSYSIEYNIDTSIESYEVDILHSVSGIGWYHDSVYGDNYEVILPTTPVYDFDMYNYEYTSSSDKFLYASGVMGYYSDSKVLTQDIGDGLWEILPVRSGVPTLEDEAFTYADGTHYIISGLLPDQFYPYDRTYRVKFNGTGDEYNEYTYVWYATMEELDVGVSGLILDNSKLYTVGDEFPVVAGYISNLGIEDDYTTALDEPIELFIDGSKAIDMSNYKEDAQVMLDPYDSSNQYQFYMDNGKLYTNIDFSIVTPKRLTARFRYLTSYIRLKIVMNTNSKGDSYYTPILDYYTLKFVGGVA